MKCLLNFTPGQDPVPVGVDGAEHLLDVGLVLFAFFVILFIEISKGRDPFLSIISPTERIESGMQIVCMIKDHIIALSLCTAFLKSVIFFFFILNTLLHARQRTGKYVIPQDANAPILLKAHQGTIHR